MTGKELQEVRTDSAERGKGSGRTPLVLAIFLLIAVLLYTALGGLGMVLSALVLIFAVPLFLRRSMSTMRTGPGDYVNACPKCGSHNRGRREVCAKCGAPLRLIHPPG